MSQSCCFAMGTCTGCQGICIGKTPLFQAPWYDKRPPFFSMVWRTSSFLSWYDKWPLYFHIWCIIMQVFFGAWFTYDEFRVLTPIFHFVVEIWAWILTWQGAYVPILGSSTPPSPPPHASYLASRKSYLINDFSIYFKTWPKMKLYHLKSVLALLKNHLNSI